MKKYLFNGAMALIVGVFIVSCSHDDISQTATVDQMSKSFDELFTELYGPIAENHNWGFNTVLAEAGVDDAAEAATRGTTRSAQPNSNQWGTHDDNDKYLDWPKPADITDTERAAVLAVFNQRGAESYTDIANLRDFFVQQVYCGQNGSKMNELACWDPQGHEVTEYPDWNGYQAYTYTTNDDIVNNFNAGKYSGNAEQGCMLMWYSSTSQWSFKTSQSGGERIYDHWRMEKINGNYYVGLDHEAWRQAPANANEEDKRDYIYNDWILKIVPGQGQGGNSGTPTIVREEPYTETKTTTTTTYRKIVDLGRVFCEDIATATMNVKEDIDYNDIVFDARVWEYYDMTYISENGSSTTYGPSNIYYQYDINLLATGGTIEEKVNDTDVHNKFGVGQTFMVNTWTPNSKAYGQYNTKTMEAANFSYTKYVAAGTDAGISSIPIYVKYKGNNMLALGDKTSGAPYKLCLPVGKLWPIERVNIRDAYPDFGSFVSSPSNTFYDGKNVIENLYTQAPTSSIETDKNNGKGIDYLETVSTSSNSSSVTVVWAGSASEDNTAITLRNYSFSAGKTLRFYGSGTIRVVDSSSQGIFESIPMSGGYCDVYISNDTQAAALNAGIITVSGVSGSNGSSYTLTKIVVL